MPKKNNRGSNKSKSQSSRPSRRRIASQQDSQLNFHQLEDRHLLAAITVTNATDLTNADTSSIAALIADDGGDGISLREAITATNNTAGEDTITFDGGVFTGGVSSLIRLTQGELSITQSLTIDASAANDVTITGDADGDDILLPGTFITDVSASFGGYVFAGDDLLNDNTRLINISDGYLTVSSLTLTGGRSTYSSGGAILDSGSGISLLDTTVSGNSTRGSNARGGGIYSFGNDLSLLNSVVSRNSTEGNSSDGGGISAQRGSVSLINSIVSGNETSGDGSEGGGIFAYDVSLVDSTVSGNNTSGDRSSGGGIAVEGSSFQDAGLSLTDSIVSGNSTTGSDSSGGGISVLEGDLTLINSMVIGNSAMGSRSEGGGISAGGDVMLTNSDVNGNSSFAAGGGIHASPQVGAFGEPAVSLTDSAVSGNSTSGYSAPGGGIFADNVNVVLVRSVVDGNSTQGIDSGGGGIYLRFGGDLIGFDSTFTGNYTAGSVSDGGAIHTEIGDVTLINSTVSGNSTAGQSADGGGISSLFGNVTLTNSTVNGNSSTGTGSTDGGGISAFRVLLTNSTVSGNSTFGEGGGVYATREVSLTNSTVADNSATGEGGGLFLANSSGLSVFRSANSIVTDNTDSGTAPDLLVESGDFEPFVDYSLIGDTAGSGVTPLTGTGNILDQPALLGPLADNGGPTLTHALLEGSPAIDSGSNGLAVNDVDVPSTSDQRGAPLIRVFGNAVDIGAFEVQPEPATPPTVLSATINEGGVLARPDLWNTLTVAFDSEVSVVAGDLSLFNISTLDSSVDLSGIGFSFDSSTNTATWDFSTLAAPLDAAFYTYELDASSITFEGASLDGDGDGIGGDDFVARHYVAIPGDANLDGVVDVLNDAFTLVANLGSTINLAWADGNFNGDGVVNVLGDAFTLVANLGRNVQVLSDLVVTNATDLVNGDTGSVADLLANDGGDGISLREAITATNNTLGEETITFDGNVFTGGADSLIRLTQGQLEVTDSVTINAATGNNVTITGDANDDDVTLPGTFITDVAFSSGAYFGGFNNLLVDNSRVIYSSAGYLTLANLTVTGGRTLSTNEGGGIYVTGEGLSLIRSTISGNSTNGDNTDGGGVSAEGANVSVIDSVVSGNSTTGLRSDGGGIYIFGGSLTVTNSTVTGNSTNGTFSGGGGIAGNEGELSIINSDVSGNRTTGSASAGGAIFARAGASVLLTNSLISDNRTFDTASNGGGLSVLGPLTLINSTISGNRAGASGEGGGIRAQNPESISIINSTIVNNVSGGALFAPGGEGGGLYLTEVPSNGPTIINSIIAGNIGRFGLPSDVFIRGAYSSDDNLRVEHSLIGSTFYSGITATTGAGNILGIPAFLGPLADNGGATLTHAPLADSPVINGGSNALAVDLDGNPLAEDQRGEGFDRIQVGTVDIGAFESTLDNLTAPPTVVSATINEGGVLARPDLLNTLTVVFDRDVTIDPFGLSLFNDSPRGIDVSIFDFEFSYDSSSSTAIWDFTSIDAFDAGNYTFLLDPNSVTVGNLTLDSNGDGIRGDALEIQHYVAIPGDANLDGTVDVLNDAFTLVANLGSTTNVAWANGNFNGDGVVNVLGDAFVLVGNLGRNLDFVANVVVSNATDDVNGDTSSLFDLITNDGGDGISLREAIAASNRTFGSNTVTFDEGVFSGGANSLIRLTQGELRITESLIIDASGATDLVITGDADGDDILVPGTFITDVAASFGVTPGVADDFLDDNSRVFNFSGGELAVLNLTVTGGRTTATTADGGGILATSGNVSLTNSVVSGNSTSGRSSDGGGISVSSGTVMLSDTSVSGNSTSDSYADGGGINVDNGDVLLTNSMVSGNSAEGRYADGGGINVGNGDVSLTNSVVSGNTTSGAGGDGGGINIDNGDVSLSNSEASGNSTGSSNADGGGINVLTGQVTLDNSFVSGNSTSNSSADGGGINVDSGDVLLTNSTVSGNDIAGSEASGGGIHAPNGTASLTNSTVSGNRTGSFASEGGGILAESAVLINSTVTENNTTGVAGGIGSLTGSLTVINSIIAGNTDNGTAPDLFVDGAVTELVVENSLIGDTTGSGITAITGAGNILDQPALLGPLADNGGPTLTHALLVGSPAIDAGSDALAVDADGNALTTDQRGASFSRILGGTIDIGAFESEFATAPVTLAATAQSQSPSLTLAGDHELRDDVFGSDF